MTSADRSLLHILHIIFIHNAHVGRVVACVGWLRLVGSLKLQVSFAKEPYKRDDILQKRPLIFRSLLIVATPYVNVRFRTQAPTQLTLSHTLSLSHTRTHTKDTP